MFCDNNYVNIFSNAIIQATIIFAFLTAFFFSYVINVEKDEFKKQIEFTVDNIYSRHSNDINNYINNSLIQEKISNNDRYTKTFIYGLIDYEQEEIIKTSKETNKSLLESNNQIIKDSLYYISLILIITILLLIIISIFMNFVYKCKLDLSTYLLDGLYILIFIFFVEVIFLNVIAKNYISANPNYIKNKIAESIIKYVNDRNNI